MKTDSKGLIGKIIYFREAEFNLALTRYKNYANGLKPLFEDLRRYELSPETIQAFHESSGGARTERAVNELKERLNCEIQKLPFAIRATSDEGTQHAIASLRTALDKIKERQNNGREALNTLPIVEGVPTITTEFEESLREEYTLRITTGEQAERYLAFEEAKKAVAQLIKSEMTPGRDFDMYDEGLILLSL